MIHDAKVEVTCDGERNCGAAIDITLRVAYAGPGHSIQTYFDDDEDIAEDLERQGWIVKDGKHYCSAECAPKDKAKRK